MSVLVMFRLSLEAPAYMLNKSRNRRKSEDDLRNTSTSSVYAMALIGEVKEADGLGEG